MLKSMKPHIGIFGRRNYGKSSFINAIANQDVAIVSEYAGTTTDPVNKTMELSSIGAAVLIDTAGIDDVGDIGKKRIQATLQVIKHVDLAILVITDNTIDSYEFDLIKQFEKCNTPFFIVHNKSDLIKLSSKIIDQVKHDLKTDIIEFSTITKNNINELIETIKKNLPSSVFNNPTILGDLVNYGDIILLVTPIDIEAPKGRIILPQVQTIRDALDNDCIIVMLKERELDAFFKKSNLMPKLVVADSQAFLKVDASTPKGMALTSFSILFARLKGNFNEFVKGTPSIGKLNDGDKVLILESCSHHVTGDDIGRVKIPRWITNFTGKKIVFEAVAGLKQAPNPIEDYSLVIQCGGCMLTRKQVLNRIQPAIDAGVPVTNYGMTIAYCHGIFNRAIELFTDNKNESIDYL